MQEGLIVWPYKYAIQQGIVAFSLKGYAAFWSAMAALDLSLIEVPTVYKLLSAAPARNGEFIYIAAVPEVLFSQILNS